MRIPPKDWLPADQKLILTKNVRRFNLMMDITLDSRCHQPVITAVTASAGAGKTTALYAFLGTSEPQLHTGLPKYIGLEVQPKSSALALAQNIVRICGYEPRGQNVYYVADEAVEKLCMSDIHLLCTDEGDRLNAESFDALRYIHDHSRIPLVIVGLPKVLKVIDGAYKEQFSSRTSLRIAFEPIQYEEFISVILPQIIMPRWEFEPDREADLLIGNQIWSWTGSSLRDTCRLIQTSSSLARRAGKLRIDLEILKDAYKFQESTPARVKREKQEREAAERAESSGREANGEMERESEQRHDAKEKRCKHS